MKFINLFILLLPLFATAQLRIVNNTLINSDSAYLYVGVNNTLSVEGSTSMLKLTAVKTQVQQAAGKNQFVLRASSQGVDTVRLYQKDKCVFTKIYKISNIPDPVVSLGKNNIKTLTVNEIIADPGLYILLPGCFINAKFPIASFSVTFMRNNAGIAKVEMVNGCKMNTACIDIVKKLLPGDKILFDDIKVNEPSGIPRTMRPVTITIR